MGFEPVIYYPKRTEKPLYQGLVQQCSKMGLSFVENVPEQSVMDSEFSVIVDALFGYALT